MSYFEFLLFGHLLFAIAWVGTDIGLHTLALRALAGPPERKIEYLGDVDWLGQRLLNPGLAAGGRVRRSAGDRGRRL